MLEAVEVEVVAYEVLVDLAKELVAFVVAEPLDPAADLLAELVRAVIRHSLITNLYI